MKRVAIAMAMAWIVVPAWCQDGMGGGKDEKKQEDKPAAAEDKIGKSKGPEILKKTAAELAKKKGYHADEKVTIPALGGRGGGQGQEPSWEGVVLIKGDLASMKGSAEICAKGAVTLVKDTKGAFVEPDKLQGQAAGQAGAFKNPQVLLGEVFRFAATSYTGNDEAVDGVDCKIVETTADPKTTEEQIKSTLDRAAKSMGGGGGGGGGGGQGPMGGMGGMLGNLANYVNKKESTSGYKVWIGKKDLLPYKCEWTLTIVVDKDKIPGGFGAQVPEKIEAATEVKISKYDEALEIDWPKEIRAKFGIAAK